MDSPEIEPFTIPVGYWRLLSDGRIQCELCPRFCKLRDGQNGMCFVRKRRGDQMVLITYGRSSGFCVDPIEKKPLSHFLPGTPTLSFGTAGCNLACKFCQNWDMSKSRQYHTLSAQATPEVIARAAGKLECRSVAFTYNEPVIFLEYAVDVAKVCHELGIKTVAVTAGEICSRPRKDFYRHIDAANVDLKAFSEEFYFKLCKAHLEPVLDTLRYIANETEVWLETTTLLIPGENDSPDELKRMTAWVVENLGPEVPMHFSAFRPDWKMLDKPRTPKETLVMAQEIARENGVRYPYTGNVHHREGDTTFCPGCNRPVIERDWYELVGWRLDNGRCELCGCKIDGVFDNSPGNWGASRLPVRLADFK